MADPGYEYVAQQRITIDGVLAFMPGDFIPASTVAEQGWGEDVAVPREVPEYVPTGPATDDETPPVDEDPGEQSSIDPDGPVDPVDPVDPDGPED